MVYRVLLDDVDWWEGSQPSNENNSKCPQTFYVPNTYIMADNGKKFSFYKEFARKLKVLFILQNHINYGKEGSMEMPMR